MCVVALFLATAVAPAFAQETSPPEPLAGEEARDQALLDAADSIAEQVSRIRGLPLLNEIPRGVKDREELRTMLIEQLHDEIPEAIFVAEEQMFKRLGLFGPEVNYRQLMLDLLTEQIAGFYDQSAKELYIMVGLPEQLQHSAMAHEIFHAIQDQHFDIGALLAPFSSQENGDFALARMALIEGDATVLMIDYVLYEEKTLPAGRALSAADIPMIAAMLLEMDTEQLAAAEQLGGSAMIGVNTDGVPSLTDSVLGSAPRIVRDLLLFPYVEGMRFVLRARANRTWTDVDAIYTNAPVSTSQILHPERYFAGELPLDVRFDASEALAEYEPMFDSVLGELQLRSWLATHADVYTHLPEPGPAAEGWRGDRLLGYRNEQDQVVAVHVSSWESEDDAREFAQYQAQIAEARYGTSTSHQTGTHGESWCLRHGPETDGHRVYVERWGELVLLIEGAPSTLDEEGAEIDPTTYLARQAVWSSLSRMPFEGTLRDREAAAREDIAEDATSSPNPHPGADDPSP
ncbi:hypothetical protein DL240_08490 [Lujinxingia litoralis]|uniref:Uncharacterized protein n=2 Tax=Lujinxingia litoralis TaxID=2211119 RepID=A0A328C8C0_9DELT|nr:hypothetical protein DL240_08490 [Lujinxingia litoralis]